MKTLEVTVCINFAPEVRFTVSGVRSAHNLLTSEVEAVLNSWTRITGLAWNKMPRSYAVESGTAWVIVQSPLDNRSDARFVWPSTAERFEPATAR
jgi:hypothetical protein